MFDKNGKKWLKVSSIQQAGSTSWVSVAGQGKWMPEDGGASNGGRWLHDI